MGLVEAGVGVVPGGGGIKETFLRWHDAKGSWDDAAWQTWMNIGYGLTGSSPQLSARLQYFRDGHDIGFSKISTFFPKLSSGFAPEKPPKATPI